MRDKALRLAVKEEMRTLRQLQGHRREILAMIASGELYQARLDTENHNLQWYEAKIRECETRLGLWRENNPS